MGYEQKYNEALRKIRELIERGKKNRWTITAYVKDFEQIFPELIESEDERISREITEFLVDFNNGEYERPNENTIDSWLSWLERQGKQILANSAKTCKNEQKPAEWSEEDEEIIEEIEAIIDAYVLEENNPKALKDWLKTLKDRYTWKPSEEQMRALHDMNLTGNISYAGQGQLLIELYNDLKKLKGE